MPSPLPSRRAILGLACGLLPGLVLGPAAGCAGWNMYLNPVRLRVRGARLLSADPAALVVAVELDVYNPNPVVLAAPVLHLVAESAGQPVAEGQLTLPVRLAAQHVSVVRAQVPLRPVAPVAGPLLLRGEVRFPTSAGTLEATFERRL